MGEKKLNLKIISSFSGKGFKQAKTEMKGLNQVVGKLGNLATGALVGAGAAAVAFAADSVKSFQSFEKGMAEVFTLLPGKSASFYGQLEKQAREAAVNMGKPVEDVVGSLYQSISAGVPPDNVFSFLETANQAAMGGVTSLETAVDGITSVVNAYGAEMIGAAEASDLMFTAVKGGKTNFEQLSNSLFNVIPTASALKVEFGNITAALATMTAQGTPTSVATTQLRQLLVELSKEGTKTSQVFKEISGVAFKDFIANGGNLQSALQLLEQYADSAGIGINDLFGSVEAGSAALSLTGAGTDKFTSELEAAGEAAGATAEAYETMAATGSQAGEELKAQFGELKLAIGEGLGPAFTAVQQSVTGMMADLTTYIKVNQEAEATITETIEANKQAALSQGELQSKITGTTESLRLSRTFLGGFVSNQWEVRDALLDTASRLAASTESYGEFEAALEAAGIGVDGLNGELQMAPNIYGMTTKAMFEYAQALREAEELTAGADQAMLQLATSYGAASVATTAVTESTAAEAEALRQSRIEKLQAIDASHNYAGALYEDVNAAQAATEAAAAHTAALAEQRVAAFEAAEGLAEAFLTAQEIGDPTAIIEAQTTIQDSYKETAAAALLAGADSSAGFQQALDAMVAIGAMSQEQADLQAQIGGTSMKINELTGMLQGGAVSVGEYSAAFQSLGANASTSLEQAVQLAQEASGLTETLANQGASGLSDYYQSLSSVGEGEQTTIVPEVDIEPATAAYTELSAMGQAYAAEIYIATPEADTGMASANVSSLQDELNAIQGTYTATVNIATNGSIPNVSNIPGRAGGGAVTAGQLYVVGERGPELFSPASNGNIFSNDDSQQVLGGTNQLNAPMTFNIYGGGQDVANNVADRVDDTLSKKARRLGITA